MKSEIPTSTAGITILIVEDSPTQAEKLAFILSKNGYRPHVANNGGRALEMIQEFSPSLVISDVVMPQMDGYQLCREIKRNSETKDMPVILLTSLTDPVDVIKGLECGADNFICKPYDEEHLLMRIAFILANLNLHREETTQMGLKIVFAGRKFFITSDRLQILNLLLSTYEEAVQRNLELLSTRDELRELSRQLEVQVEERTASLQAAEAKFRHIVEQTFLGIYILQGDSFVYTNPRMTEILGYAGRELVSKPAKEWVLEEDQGVFSNTIVKSLSGESFPRRCTVRMRHQNAHAVYLDMVVGVSEFEGQPAVLGTLLDVTEKRAAEDSLRLSEARYRSLIKATSQIVWNTDPEGRVCGKLPEWQAFTGQGDEDVQGAGWSSALHPEDMQSTLEIWKRAVETKSLYDVEYRIRRHDGVYRYFSVRGVPVLNEDGSIREWVGTCTDIHDRKSAEDQIRKMNLVLEERVKDRTRQLEAANQELEAFSYSVSHDLRAPLRHIGGFVNLLESSMGDDLNDKTKRYLGVISDSALKMGRLIDDLLLFSRSSRTQLNMERVELDKLVDEAIRDLQPDINGRVLLWRRKKLPTVEGDPSMLKQVFANLIGNAVKYSSKREKAEIEIAPEKGSGEEIVVKVSDNGAGFDMKYKDKLFGVFQRLHSDQEFEGTGIGLANVRRIISRHGGRVWAEGKLDEGSTFYFSLPKKKAHHE